MKPAFPLLAIFLLALLFKLPAADVPAKPPDPAKPNILFLITDQQWGGALGCAGNPYVKTPNLDRLAARGVRFVKSYCTYPLCCPSRGSLFTSRMPHELGIYGNTDAELSTKGVPMMGNLFRAAGYETAYAGKWHLQAPFPAFDGKKMPGFDVLPLAGRNPFTVALNQEGKGLTVDPNTADAAIKFLRQPHSKPFLLVASILNPHDICEYPESAALQKLLAAAPAQLPPVRPNWHDTEPLPSVLRKANVGGSKHADWAERQWQEYVWVYYRLVEIADAEVGRVLTALDQSGLNSNTVVVFTSDHGEMMGAHGLCTKQLLYDESAAVPLVIAPPGSQARVDTSHLASGLDIMPTLLAYAGIAAPSSLEGQSLRPLVEGKTTPWREFVVVENISGKEARMVRTARYKYIIYAKSENPEQFFDLEQDPGELKNLMNVPAFASEVARHRRLLEQWRKETHDEIGRRPAVAKGQQSQNQDGKLTVKNPAAGNNLE